MAGRPSNSLVVIILEKLESFPLPALHSISFHFLSSSLWSCAKLGVNNIMSQYSLWLKPFPGSVAVSKKEGTRCWKEGRRGRKGESHLRTVDKLLCTSPSFRYTPIIEIYIITDLNSLFLTLYIAPET